VKKGEWFLLPGNGHQLANRAKAMQFVQTTLEGVQIVDAQTVKFEGYGLCHFHAFTSSDGAMISSPGNDDNTFGAAAWHLLDCSMMFRDFGDGRCVVYVGPIRPLFEKRTIGQHGVTWENVRKNAVFTQVFRTSGL
jgi:hypothetical protein